MKTNLLAVAIAVNVFAMGSVLAQEKSTNPNLLAQLEQRLAESDNKAKALTGKPKTLWLLREAKIENIIERLKAGQAVDPKELDVVLKGQVN